MKKTRLSTMLLLGFTVFFTALTMEFPVETHTIFSEITAEAAEKHPSMENCLFLGDSRTVGLMEYGQIEEADYFCNVGMSVFNLLEETVSVPNVGKVTLPTLLDNKEYKNIYIMLGINEIGYPFESIVSKYEEILEFIKEKQTNAKIIIQANLHVTKSRSDRDSIYNNTMINKLNNALLEFADNKTTFYIDVNSIFDDQNGALTSEKSSDEAHLYGKYYVDWADWIIQETEKVLKEE